MEWRTFNPAAIYSNMEIRRTLTIVQLFQKEYVRLGRLRQYAQYETVFANPGISIWNIRDVRQYAL